MSILILFCVLAAPPAVWGDASIAISEAKPDANGILIHDVTSPFQAGVTHIKVLCPDHSDAEANYPVVYI